MNGLAQQADAGPWESIWVYDHFHTVPVPSEEATHEAWTLMAAFAASRAGAARSDVHVHELPQPGVPREGRRDRRHRLRRTRRDGHRRRLVRARVARLRLRLPARRPSAWAAARGRRDHAPGLDAREVRRSTASTTRWTGRSCGRTAAARRDPALDRRRRREGDAADRGEVRRYTNFAGRPEEFSHKSEVLRGHCARRRHRLRRDRAVRRTSTRRSARRGRGAATPRAIEARLAPYLGADGAARFMAEYRTGGRPRRHAGAVVENLAAVGERGWATRSTTSPRRLRPLRASSSSSARSIPALSKGRSAQLQRDPQDLVVVPAGVGARRCCSWSPRAPRRSSAALRTRP